MIMSAVIATATCNTPSPATADSAATGTGTNDTVRLPDVNVVGSTESTGVTPPVEGTRINQGKKISVADLEQIPQVINNNYRQAFNELPGLLVSEMPTPSHVNINYRGIGDPHESEYVLTLRDGMPLVSDWMGYPTAYYTPPLESVGRVELVRGGGALLYGPQPGPVINYVTLRPPLDQKFTASTAQTFGSDGLYSTYNSVGGTLGDFGYLGSFHHRQADGPRDNGDYAVFNGELKLAIGATTDSRWYFGFYGYEAENGEPGRLTLAQYLDDRDQTIKEHDRLWVERYVPSITYERDVSEDTQVIVTGWAGMQDRFSRRQNSSATSTNLDRQEFFFAGVDTRARHDWEAWDNRHTLTAGFVLYGASAPRSRETNADLTATDGALNFDLDRNTLYGSIFAENKFQFGKLGVIPSARVEFIREDVEENLNLARGSTVSSEFSDVVPLFGLGLTYDLTRLNQIYANVSQGYRPPKYDDLVNPTSTGQLPSDPEPGEIMNYEIGLRGSPMTWFRYDASFFYTDWDNVVETLDLGGGNTVRNNSGRAQYTGFEAGAAFDLIGAFDAWRNTAHGSKWGSLSIHGSVSVLDAEFVSGNNDGNEPAYAPDYIVKAGVTYSYCDRLKVALVSVFVDEHYWQDSNTDASTPIGVSQIPSYKVWDLSAEAKVYKDVVSVFAGINNLFDEDYFSRVRSDGIEPALERTYYGGVKLTF
jgi:Fe(3+) dicitrate transport protein